MTLDTRIFIEKPVPHEDLTNYVLDILARVSDGFDSREAIRVSDNPDSNWVPNPKAHELSNTTRVFQTRVGQGLCAWFMLYYGVNGNNHITPEENKAHESYCNVVGGEWFNAEDGLCDGKHEDRPPCWAKMSFDTGYSYRGKNGESCTDLHAMLIVLIGKWLDEHDVPWKWQNEYTGEVFDKYDGLAEFLGNGDEAKEWFTNTVVPGILGKFTDN